MQSETRIDTRVKINTSIAGNVTKLHTQESFNKEILTLPNNNNRNICKAHIASIRAESEAPNESKLGIVVYHESLSKPIDFGFKRSRVRGK